jgi:enoyl-[acyl-carrier-protein] reductase (NADH)
VPLSAYVTYSVTSYDAEGNVVRKFPVRAVAKPSSEALEKLARQLDPDAVAATAVRSPPARIGTGTGIDGVRSLLRALRAENQRCEDRVHS